jgi:hypothetical protein
MVHDVPPPISAQRPRERGSSADTTIGVKGDADKPPIAQNSEIGVRSPRFPDRRVKTGNLTAPSPRMVVGQASMVFRIGFEWDVKRGMLEVVRHLILFLAGPEVCS